jgi:hypothetical protein
MVNFSLFRRTTLLRFQRLLAAVLLLIAIAAATSLEAQQNSASPSSASPATPPVLDPEITSYNAYLLKPANAVRTRYHNDRETPLPPEEPTAKNPRSRAIIYYYLKSVPSNPLTLEIHDAQGKVVRRFNSLIPAADSTPKNVPNNWFGPSTHLSKDAGLNRFVWDMRYEPPQVLDFTSTGGPQDHIEHAVPSDALPAGTPREQTLGPLAVPGQYEVFFIGNGMVMKQPLTITLDPRVHVSQADLEAQLLALKRIDSGLTASTKAFHSITNLRAAIADRRKTLGVASDENSRARSSEQSSGPKEKSAQEKAQDEKAATASPETKASADALNDLDRKAAAILEGTLEAPGVGPINRDLAHTSLLIQSSEAAPSQTGQAALDQSCSQLNKILTTWRDLDSQTVPATNTIIAKSNLAALPTATVMSITAAPRDAASTDACAP